MPTLRIRIAAATLIAAMLTVPVHAETFVLRLGWDEMRTALDQGEYCPKVRVQTGSGKGNRITGQLVGATDDALQIERRGGQVLIGRNEFHSIRLIPRKAGKRKNRNWAIVAAAPVGFGTLLATWALGCIAVGGCPESGATGAGQAGIFGAAFAVPILIYRWASRKDRGAVLIVVKPS